MIVVWDQRVRWRPRGVARTAGDQWRDGKTGTAIGSASNVSYDGRSVEGKDAEREAERMQVEVDDNMPSARVGRSSKY